MAPATINYLFHCHGYNLLYLNHNKVFEIKSKKYA